MKITCTSAHKQQQIANKQAQAHRTAGPTPQELIGRPVNQVVNLVGKYLYNTIDGAYKIKNTTNTCDVYMTVYYQIPYLAQRPGRPVTYSDLHELPIDISMTTYQNKIRVNLIVMDPEEETIDFSAYTPERFKDTEHAKELILTRIQKVLTKYFDGYEFLF